MESHLAKKIISEDKEYVVASLDKRSKEIIAPVDNLDKKLSVKRRLLAVVTGTNLSYVAELKRDIIADKTGLTF